MNIGTELKDRYIRLRKKLHYIRHAESHYCESEKKIKDLEERLQWFKDHADITTLKPATGYLRKKQKDLIHFAADFFKEIESLDIHPFLAAGTLLGYYRNKSFIPWDDDLDFDLFREEYERLISHFKDIRKCFIIDTKEEDYKSFVDNITNRYKNEYVLFVYHNQIQVSKGYSIVDRLAIDFGTIDYFDEKMEFDEHKRIISECRHMMYSPEITIKEKYNQINSRIDRVNYKSNNLYFGLDNMDSYKKEFNNRWMDKNDILPLKKVMFEGVEFWCARHEEEYVKFFYDDYDSFPEDVGTVTHDYWDDYLKNNYINVEFYLCDAFEILHFLPLYQRFRENGINAWFVAEPCTQNTSGEWFNYSEAVFLLQSLGLKYMNECNPDVQYAFTTQDAYILGKYSNNTIRINMSYGCGCLKGSFGYTDRTTRGFDYRFVHGEFGKRTVGEFFPEDRILTIGFPKHSFHRLPGKNEVRSELGIITNKAILVYFPTWDEENTIREFAEELSKLSEDYFIITKLHHVLERSEEHRDLVEKIYGFSSLVLPGNYDFEKAAIIADVAICDAKSGSSLEVAYLNDMCKVVFLTNRRDSSCYFEDTRKAFNIVGNPKDLVNAILEPDKQGDIKKAVLADHLGKRDYDYLGNIVEMIKNNAFSKKL